jgi:uncharacterized protein (TIGR02646 family)
VDSVIPVVPRKAPLGFNERVFRRGRRWLKKKGLALQGPVPAGVELKPCWRGCLAKLHERYHGVCAYLCIYFERALGAATVDHFVSKSSRIEDAYRWRNYRLACQRMNSRKSTFDDLLDPFTMAPDTFCLSLLDGAISPSPQLDAATRAQAETTIVRLGLDDGDCRRARRDAFDEYLGVGTVGPIPFSSLRKHHPFVAYEVNRQQMRRPDDGGP